MAVNFDERFWVQVTSTSNNEWFYLNTSESLTFVSSQMANIHTSSIPAVNKRSAISYLATIISGLNAGNIKGLAVRDNGSFEPISE